MKNKSKFFFGLLASQQEKLFTNANALGELAVEVRKEIIPEMDISSFPSPMRLKGIKTSDPLWKSENAAKNG